jgi:error-prone DNA polymerase
VFITIEDETGIANLVIWPNLYEKQRRIILSSGMLAVYGCVQRDGEVVHLIAHRLIDLSPELASVGERGAEFSVRLGRSDEMKAGGRPDPGEMLGGKTKEIYIPDLHINRIKVKTREFR